MLDSTSFFPRGRQILVTWLAAASLALVGLASPAGSQPASTISSSPPSFAQSSSDTPAVVRDGVWYLRTSNSSGIAHTQFRYGNPGDTPLMGDWDGSGSDTPAVVRGNTWYLRYSNTSGTADITFTYGNAGDVPVVGDWDGDGTDTPGVVRGHTWFLRNSNTEGVADVTFTYGNVGDIPVVGDWDGDGTDTPGVVRGHTWFLRNSNTSGAANLTFGYGNVGDMPLSGDWDGDGTDTPGVVRGNVWYLRNSHTTGTADASFRYGNVGDIPLSWHGDFRSCLSAEQGYQIGYPPGWHTNTANGLPPCSVFDPQPIDLEPGTELPFGIAVVVRVHDVAFEVASNPDPQHDRVIQRDGPLLIAGRNAVLLETEATGEGLRPEGLLSYYYVVDLDGRSLVATTYDAGALPYGDKKRILDRMIDTLSLR